MLQNYRTAIAKREEAEDDLNMQIKSQMTAEIKAKQREWKEAEDELKKVEARLGKCSGSHRNGTISLLILSCASLAG